MEITAEKPVSTGGTFNRELHRLIDGELVFEVPSFETEYGAPDPKRYVLAYVGYSDLFEELRYNATDPDDLVDRMILEFEVVNSKKWQGQRFSQAVNIPKDWTDDRGTLNQFISAILGKPFEAGDTFNFGTSLGSQFEGVVEVKTSERGRDYARVVTFLPLAADDDDVIPVKTAAAGDDFPTS
jgi:hypothetical protein